MSIHRSVLRSVALGGYVLTAALAATGAQAQSADAAAAPPPAASEVPDIIVTASRRAEPLQNVPISVTALSANAIAAAGVTNTAQLAQVTPGLLFVRNSTSAQFTIRGVSARAVYPGDESNIALYVDGVYQASPIANSFDLLEISRIEVLRGPQGTLFGRNATGGLINIITPDPSFTPRADIDLRYGNFGTVQLRGYATAPISDKVAFDLTGNLYSDDGYVKNLAGGRDLGRRRTKTARGKLMFKPSDDAKIVLTASHTHSDDAAAIAYQPLDGNTKGAAVPGAIVPTKPWTTALTFTPFNRLDETDVSLRTSFGLGAVSLETTSAYQRNRSHNDTDNDSSQANIQEIDSHQVDTNLSQEIRLVSRDNPRFQWTAGVFGFHEVSRYEPLDVYAGPFLVFDHHPRNRTSSAAAFAEGTYALTPKLKLTLGGRYSWEQRHYSYVTNTVTSTLAPITLTGDAKKSFRLFTPRASVQYVFSPRLNIYATYSRGAKSGLYNTTTDSNVAVRPEKLDDWEIGLKSSPASWLRFNASAFYYKYKDIQLTQRDAFSSFLANAGRATLYGGEAELTMVPTHDLSIGLGASYLHTRIDQFLNAVVTVPQPGGGNLITVGDDSGKQLIRSPKLTMNGSIDYTHDFAFGKAGASANVFHSAHFFFNYDNRLRQGAYTLVNARVWVEPIAALRIGLFVDNLTNRAVLNNVLDADTADEATYMPPRTYGIEARVHF